MEQNNGYSILEFRKVITHIGLVFVTFCLIVNFVPALYVSMTTGVFPSVGDLVQLWLAAAAAFGIGYFVQPISFFPIVGLAGTFIVWISGNVGEVRVPAAAMAQKVTNCEQGTPKAEIMGALGICGSVFVSVTLVTIFAIIGAAVIPMMPPFVMKAFKFILPAVLGAVYASLCGTNMVLGLISLVACLAGKIIFPKIGVPGGALMLVNILMVCCIARVYFLTVMKGGK